MSDPPSTAAIAIATAILSGIAGYMIAQGSSLGLFGGNSSSSSSGSGSSSKKPKTKSSWPNSYDVTVHPDSSDEELMKTLKGDDDADLDSSSSSSSSDETDKPHGELKSFPDNKEECKLVLVVRTDLGMGKGKIAAQCSHATLACYTYFLAHAPASPLLKRWQSLGQAKVALQCKDEEELLTLQAQALSVGLCARVIHDAGRTQIASGSATVVGIGPGPKSVVDGVTGRLRLL
ncbi:hypothetical protein MMC19_002123 [Ptychographa xylographoides]|nr:hypothetical protein [Ptychographa xylographoides]